MLPTKEKRLRIKSRFTDDGKPLRDGLKLKVTGTESQW